MIGGNLRHGTRSDITARDAVSGMPRLRVGAGHNGADIATAEVAVRSGIDRRTGETSMTDWIGNVPMTRLPGPLGDPHGIGQIRAVVKASIVTPETLRTSWQRAPWIRMRLHSFVRAHRRRQ